MKTQFDDVYVEELAAGGGDGGDGGDGGNGCFIATSANGSRMAK